jgi:hypothetical protein
VAPIDPVEEARSLRLYRLLLWQARRTSADRWSDENNEPYFRAVGKKYVQDAEGLVQGKGGAERLAPAREVRADLDRPVRLALRLMNGENDAKGRRSWVHITSESEFELRYHVQAEGLSGFPVVYAEPDKAIASESPARLKELTKPQARPIGGKEPGAPLALARLKNPHYARLFLPEKASADTRAEVQTCTAHGLYRGYRFPLETSVYFHPRANTIVYRNPLPEKKSAILVYADNEVYRRFSEQGTLAILVDYSGSMVEPSNPKIQGSPPRIQEAKRALRRMLEALPENMEVTLWLFRGYPLARDPRAGRDVEIRQLAATDQWARGDAERFLARLDGYTPDGGTPLFEAMERARSELLRSSRQRKAMVVLTDGVPNDPEIYLGPDGDRLIRGRLNRVFASNDIRVDVVGFQVHNLKDKNEIVVLPKFIRAVNDLERGAFHRVSDTSKLIETLHRTLTWTYQLRKPNSREEAFPTKKQPPAEICREQMLRGLELKNWLPVVPKKYEFWEKKLFPDDPQYVSTSPGELKVYRISRGGLRRAVFSRWLRSGDVPWPRDETASWQMAVFNHRRVKKSQEMSVAVESLQEDRDDPRPSHLWLELQGPDHRPVLGLRWGNRLGYPAPTWQVQSTRPLPRSTLRAWVRDTDPAPHFVPRGKADDNPHVVETVPVQIESIKVEFFPMVDPLGRRCAAEGKPAMPCVVVRLSHPKGRPAFARPVLGDAERSLDPAKGGCEHHFYAEAGNNTAKYTGIFWYSQLQGRDVESLLRGINLYSVDAFKMDHDTRTLRFDLGPPPPEDTPEINHYLQYLRP